MIVAFVILVFIFVVIVAFVVFVFVVIVAFVVFVFVVLMTFVVLVLMSLFYCLYDLFQAFFSGDFAILHFVNDVEERLDDFNFLGVSCAELDRVNHISQFNDGRFITRGVLHEFVKPRFLKTQAHTQNDVRLGNGNYVLRAGLVRVRVRPHREEAKHLDPIATDNPHPVGDYVRCRNDTNLFKGGWRARGLRGRSSLRLQCGGGRLWLLRCGGWLWLRCSGGWSWLLCRGGRLCLRLRRYDCRLCRRCNGFPAVGAGKKGYQNYERNGKELEESNFIDK